MAGCNINTCERKSAYNMYAARSFQPCVDFSQLEGVSAAVKQNVADLASDPNYYVTPEICRELRHIDAGVNHIRLDHDILKNDKWRHECDPATVHVHRQDATNVLQSATERLLDAKQRMDAMRIHRSTDDQDRCAHHQTHQELRDIEKELRPYAHDSVVRLKQYANRIGVTDRYTSYQHNLNRGNRHPINLEFSWLNPSFPKQPHDAAKLRMESDKLFYRKECKELYPDRVDSEPKPEGNRCVRNPCVKPLSVEEQVGINMTFPGTTEYIDRYSTPIRDGSTTDFIINPTPDYRIGGRPLGRQRYLCTETEYQHRYVWPNGEHIMKFPWMRK